MSDFFGNGYFPFGYFPAAYFGTDSNQNICIITGTLGNLQLSCNIELGEAPSRARPVVGDGGGGGSGGGSGFVNHGPGRIDEVYDRPRKRKKKKPVVKEETQLEILAKLPALSVATKAVVPSGLNVSVGLPGLGSKASILLPATSEVVTKLPAVAVSTDIGIDTLVSSTLAFPPLSAEIALKVKTTVRPEKKVRPVKPERPVRAESPVSPIKKAS